MKEVYTVNMITLADLSTNALLLIQRPIFHVFMWMVLIDIFTGTVKAVKLKKTNSTIGIDGILRHLLVITVMILIGIYLPLMNLETYMQTIYGYMIFQYLTSLAENWGAMGYPLPSWIKETLVKVNKKLDDGTMKISDVKEINIIPKDKED